MWRQAPLRQAQSKETQSATQSTILPIEQIPHRLPPSLIGFTQRLALVGIHSMLSRGRGFLGCAALGATIGKTGLIRLKLELLFADAADFDWESHLRSMILRAYAIEKRFASKRTGPCP